ncbi:MAG: SPFH domain-containing protein [Candidatus Neomarinimicrobiota bacterium]|jgi:membrane protease subunit HflC
MSFKSFIWLLIVALIVFVGWKSVIILDEDEQMLLTRFGQLTGEPVTTAGLHLVTPLISKPYIYKKNLIEWHSDVAEMPTKDDKFIAIESYAYWQITDPQVFYQRVRTIPAAEKRLADLMDGTLRDEVARHTLTELIRSSNRRMDITEIQNVLKVPGEKTTKQTKGQQATIVSTIYKHATTALDSLQMGIKLVDFNLKTVNFIRVIE